MEATGLREGEGVGEGARRDRNRGVERTGGSETSESGGEWQGSRTSSNSE